MATLEIDVGNTRLKWRLRCADGEIFGAALVRRKFQSTSKLLEALSVQLGMLSTAESVNKVLVASVARGEVSASLAHWSMSEFRVSAEFAYVTPQCAGVSVGYEKPGQLGIDRWLAVLAAHSYPAGGAVIVDCGSAITVDVLKGDDHLGGYIVPGFRLMHDSLFKDTAQVRVTPDLELAGEPGRNTSDAVNSGLPLMVVGFVSEVLLRLASKGWWGEPFGARVFVTGGDGELVATLLKADSRLFNCDIAVVSDLVLDGLALVDTRQWPWE